MGRCIRTCKDDSRYDIHSIIGYFSPYSADTVAKQVYSILGSVHWHRLLLSTSEMMATFSEVAGLIALADQLVDPTLVPPS
ncbi:hypothetical protein FRC02_009740 [Tulasnella sp. 418]|nr:hypothetical protein FRC02_009740 [Tulasnella sp. 418]